MMIGHPLDRHPFPVAYSARLLSIAQNPGDQIEAAQNFVELTAATLGVLALGWCHARELQPGGVREWEKKLGEGGITLSKWTSMVRSAVKEMKAQQSDPLARAIRLAANQALPGIETYNPIRNIYAHGGKPRLNADRESAMQELLPGITAILDGIEPLTHIRIGRVLSCRSKGSSYLADLELLAGPAEPFASRSLACLTRFETGTLLAFHEGSLDFAVDLAPYIVWQRCLTCSREELFYLHQRKKGSHCYFSFSTGHELSITGTAARPAAKSPAALGMAPLGSVRAAAASGWRATWTDLASRPARITARLIDITLAALIAAAGYLLARTAGAPALISAVAVAMPLAIIYEPLASLTGGTPGKRLLRIRPVSVWDSRSLSQADALRRALTVSAQVLFPPLALHNLAWLLRDPARQCLHDRIAACIVIAGRDRQHRNR